MICRPSIRSRIARTLSSLSSLSPIDRKSAFSSSSIKNLRFRNPRACPCHRRCRTAYSPLLFLLGHHSAPPYATRRWPSLMTLSFTHFNLKRPAFCLTFTHLGQRVPFGIVLKIGLANKFATSASRERPNQGSTARHHINRGKSSSRDFWISAHSPRLSQANDSLQGLLHLRLPEVDRGFIYF